MRFEDNVALDFFWNLTSGGMKRKAEDETVYLEHLKVRKEEEECMRKETQQQLKVEEEEKVKE